MSFQFSRLTVAPALALLVLAGPSLAGTDEQGQKIERIVRVAHAGGGAWLGVEIGDAADAPDAGALVLHVTPGSPAAEAGIEDGDVIVRFDGQAVGGPAGLVGRMQAKQAGDAVDIVVRRDGRERTLAADLGARPEAFEMAFDGLEDLDLDLDDLHEQLGKLEHLEHLNWRERGDGHDRHVRIVCRNGDCTHSEIGARRPLLGVHLVSTTPELSAHLGGEEREGVLVSKVVAETAAERAGVRVGDLIVSVAGEQIADAGDLRRALGDQAGKSVQLEVIRDGESRTMRVDLPALEPEAEAD